MRIAVTGGAGFIGSNFVYYILDNYKSDTVICFDALTYAGNLRNLESAFKNRRFVFIKGNITNKNDVASLLKDNGIDAVINLAAETHVDRSIENPSVFAETNVVGTQILLDTCIKYGVKRFHQVSTDEVYGSLPLDKPELLFDESSPLKPSNPYSATKAGADLLALAYCRTYGIKVTISRCSNNYGPYQFPEKLIPLCIFRALEGKDIPVYGTGVNVRDWIYVTEHCAALDMILRNGRAGEIYNIGSYNEKNNLSVVKTILKHLNASESLIKFVTDRKAHDLRYATSAEKIQADLGFSAQINFNDGIVRTLEWYKNNKLWRESIINGEYIDYYKKCIVKR